MSARKKPSIQHVVTGQCRSCGCDVYRDDVFFTLMGDYLLCKSCYETRSVPKRNDDVRIEAWDESTGAPYF